MIERSEGFGFEVFCDCCPCNSEEFDVDTHEELKKALRKAGWGSRMIGGKLLHRCPACAEEEKPW
jgi:hypothetical protein